MSIPPDNYNNFVPPYNPENLGDSPGSYDSSPVFYNMMNQIYYLENGEGFQLSSPPTAQQMNTIAQSMLDIYNYLKADPPTQANNPCASAVWEFLNSVPMGSPNNADYAFLFAQAAGGNAGALSTLTSNSIMITTFMNQAVNNFFHNNPSGTDNPGENQEHDTTISGDMQALNNDLNDYYAATPGSPRAAALAALVAGDITQLNGDLNTLIANAKSGGPAVDGYLMSLYNFLNANTSGANTSLVSYATSPSNISAMENILGTKSNSSGYLSGMLQYAAWGEDYSL